MSSSAHNSKKNGVISVEPRRRRLRHHQRHGGTRNNGRRNTNNGKNNNGKNDKIGMDGRNGTNEYRFPESPNHFATFLCQSVDFFVGHFAYSFSECRASDGV